MDEPLPKNRLERQNPDGSNCGFAQDDFGFGEPFIILITDRPRSPGVFFQQALI